MNLSTPATGQPNNSSQTRQGLLCALGCYALWGSMPIYWHPMAHAPMDALQMLSERMLWSSVLLVILLLVLRKGPALRAVLRTPRQVLLLSCSSLLIGGNWLLYVWAMVNQHILDAGLGYFISPLVNVALGRIIFGERLNRGQWLAMALAVIGIIWLVSRAGHIPWVALGLALSFGLYGAIRKQIVVDALAGLAFETFLLLPIGLIWLGVCAIQGTYIFRALDGLQKAVLIGSGVITVVPLLLYVGAARRIPLSLLGMLQYCSPTLQTLFGLLLGERLLADQLIGYGWVWAGVLTFLLSSRMQGHRTRETVGP